MKRRSRTRRVVKRTGTPLCLLTFGLFVASLQWTLRWSDAAGRGQRQRPTAFAVADQRIMYLVVASLIDL